ncbi:MAG: autotransporter-associated beta strand repeat-containing protein [Kiritimatiellae bacterium]|nr:autotransporter-associated beta strand repeat-containing protein [Kiritimatiellia bacterium]
MKRESNNGISLGGILLSGIVAVAFLQGALAGTSTWKANATGGWNDSGSWEGGVPNSSSTVVVPDNVDLPVYDADAACAGAVAAITLGTGSRIVFNLTDSECTMSGTITGNGTIVKYGTNIVHLTNETQHGYYAKGGGMQVFEGILECPQTFVNNSSATMYIGALYVAEGATFKPYARYRTTFVTSLTGKGTIYNTLTGGYWPLRYDSDELCVFEGTITGKIKLQINGPIDMTTVSNSFEGYFSLYNTKADVGVTKFGNGQEAYTSLGCCWYQWDSDPNRYIDYGAASGRIRYLGNGETSSRMFRLNEPVGQNVVLDAGAHGGLILTGRIFANKVGQKILTFDGSNTAVCVHSGGTGDYGDNTIYLAKSGTGTWRFEGTTNRLSRGVVGVEQGTLQFDSLTETNIPCSFGLSTRLAKKYKTTEWDESQRADYAILLGSGDAEGVLEWVGTNLWDNASSTRPVAVTGKGGRIVSSVVGRRIGLKGAFSADAGGGTLTLDGDGTTNYLYNVSDGHGKMSLAKDGSGTWILAGDQTFSGKLAVNAGEIVVSSTFGKKYSWYRFTLKGNTGNQIRLYEFALYDASGNRIDRGLTSTVASYNTIPSPGTACYWGREFENTLSHLFDGYAQWASGNPYLFAPMGAPDPANPDTWMQIVMRLNDSVASAAYYDICSEDSSATAAKKVTDWTMEASADGLFWDKVADVSSFSGTYGGKSWISSSTAFTNNQRIPSGDDFAFRLDNGKSLITGTPSQLSNATVSVAPGAVLRAEGDVTISGLEADATGAGIGTIDGFAFAANGTLNLTGIDRLTTSVELPVGFVNVSGTENIPNWSLSIGGRHANGRISCANGCITVAPLGMSVIVR